MEYKLSVGAIYTLRLVLYRQKSNQICETIFPKMLNI